MAARQGKLRTGTSPRRQWDVGRIRAAIAGAGVDTRHWVSYGTVAVVGDDGEASFEDPQAVHIGPEGVTVDVLLQPSLIPVTCRYAGIAAGTHGCVMYPIAPGDEVLVLIPDGETGSVPVCYPALSSDADLLPLGDDRKPLFKNDRLLIQTKTVPVDIRTAGGGRVQVLQDGTVETDGSQVLLGAAAALDALMKGTTYRNAEATFNTAFSAWVTAVGVVIAAVPGLPPPAAAAFVTATGAFQAAIAAFEGGAAGYLSTYSKTR